MKKIFKKILNELVINLKYQNINGLKYVKH